LTETPPATCASLGLPLAGSQTRDPESEGPFVSPHVTPGPTELVSGFYVDAFGPPPWRLPEGCEAPAEKTGSGTVEVRGASGEMVATQTVEEGHFAEIPLPAGSYTIVGTFTGVKFNGEHPEETESIVIPPGDTVRKDFLVELG
jgi:hypothetical protein